MRQSEFAYLPILDSDESKEITVAVKPADLGESTSLILSSIQSPLPSV